MKSLVKSKSIVIGLILVLIPVLCALFAGLLAPSDPMKIEMTQRFSAPSSTFPLGTDAFGRCIVSRLIYGARYSLGLSSLVMFGIIVTAVPIAMAVAYKGGSAETIFLWLCDISMALPPTVLVLSITGILGNGISNLVFSTLFSYWGWYGRMVRSHTSVELSKGYVTYAVTGGMPMSSILSRQVLPNILPVLLVLFCLGVGDTVLMISGYSFLGIGLPSGTPEWGAMLNESRSNLLTSPQYALYPGFCVFLTVCGFNLIGEGVRKVLSVNDIRRDYE